MRFKKEILIGLVIVIAIGILFAGMQFLKGVNIFGNNRTFYTTYDNVKGLTTGSQVVFSGVPIGVVTKIQIDEKNQNEIRVEFNVNNSTLKIPEDSKATLGADLLGGGYINLEVGSSDKMVENKSFIPGKVTEGMIESVTSRLDPIETKMNKVLVKLGDITQSIDTTLGDDGNNLRSIIVSLKKSLQNVEGITGNLNTVIAQEAPKIGALLDNMTSVTNNLKKNNETITASINNFKEISDSLKVVDLNGLAENAKKALKDVSEITTQINEGDGTLTQLIKSDSLINGINAMVDEANRLIENINAHPSRYIRFSVFGGKEKGLKLDARDEKKLQEIIDKYPN